MDRSLVPCFYLHSNFRGGLRKTHVFWFCQLFHHFWLAHKLYVLITHGTEWPILCWCADKELLTQTLTPALHTCTVGSLGYRSVYKRHGVHWSRVLSAQALRYTVSSNDSMHLFAQWQPVDERRVCFFATHAPYALLIYLVKYDWRLLNSNIWPLFWCSYDVMKLAVLLFYASDDK